MQGIRTISYSVFPALAATIPILHFYQVNRSQYPFDVAIPAVVFSALAGLLAYVICLALLRRADRSAAVASIGIVLVILSGRVTAVSLHELASILPILISGGVLVGALWVKWSNLIRLHLVSTLLAFMVIFFGMTLSNVLTYREVPYPDMYPQRRYDSAAQPPAHAPKPDIYYIILDCYGRTDALEQHYHYSNRGFTEKLKARGFQLVTRATSNYSQTSLSISSSLEGSFPPDRLPAAINKFGFRPGVARSISGSSSIKRYLKQAGYHCSATETGYGLTEPLESDSVYRRPLDYNYFLMSYAETTPLKWIDALDGAGRAAHRRLVEFQLNTVPEMARDGRPDFIFVHVPCPHIPFVFTSTPPGVLGKPIFTSGDIRSDDPELERLFQKLYAEQADGLNSRVETMVERLMRKREDPAWVIIQGDHGPGNEFRGDDANGVDFRVRFPILMAILQPENVKTTPPEDLTPVNLFAYILNSQWNSGIEYMENRHRYSPIMAPWRLQNVELDEIQSQP